MQNESDNVLTDSGYSLPLRSEIRKVMHVLHAQAGKVKTGLDIGFTNPAVSSHLRSLGGYWMTVEPSPARRQVVADELGENTVLCTGANGELPFEDRQFDALVLADGTIPNGETALSMIHECHRVLKTGGLFVMTVAYRKRFGLAFLLNRSGHAREGGGWYSEKEIFNLLKDGFDVLGFHYSCRFWVQMVRQWADRRKSGWHGAANVWLRFLYGLAWTLDLPLFLTRGYQMTVFGRRKGWRGQTTKVHTSSTPVSDAMLFNPRYTGSHVSWDKFK